MATMHAIRMHDYGGPEVLSFEEAPRPEAGAGEVLVRIHAAGVNPIDWKLREGRVITTAAAENESYLRELGADQVIDYRRERFEDLLHDLDAVLDTIGGDTQKRSLQILTRGGTLASTVGIQVETEAQEKGI